MGGEGARQNNTGCNREEKEVRRDDFALVYVIYRDHVLFINEDPENIVVSVRVAIGWLAEHNSDEIVLLMDRSCNPQPSERIGRSSGLRILRSDILHISEVPKSMLDKLTSDSNVDRYTKNK